MPLTFQAAIKIARNLKYGLLHDASLPDPSITEAIELIQHERRTCGFNWITGEEAVKALKKSVDTIQKV